MTFTANIENFRFPECGRSAFEGKRVLITGSGKDGGIGQALALAAAANGAKAVCVHFFQSYRDGFDLVEAIRGTGVDAFAWQGDVTIPGDLWSSRSHLVDQMGGKGPDLIICNSGLSEKGYRYGCALPEIDGEPRAERRARVRQAFMDQLQESKQVIDTKIDGFFAMSHLWAGEAVYHKRPLQLLYVSSMQAIEPGMAVPGYVVANWGVLRLPEVLRVNLGKSASMVSSACIMLPFIRTDMTQDYADNPKVFGRWQPRMLETREAAESVTQLISRPQKELDLGNYKLNVTGSAEEIKMAWSRIRLEAVEEALDWAN